MLPRYDHFTNSEVYVHAVLNAYTHGTATRHGATVKQVTRLGQAVERLTTGVSPLGLRSAGLLSTIGQDGALSDTAAAKP